MDPRLLHLYNRSPQQVIESLEKNDSKIITNLDGKINKVNNQIKTAARQRNFWVLIILISFALHYFIFIFLLVSLFPSYLFYFVLLYFIYFILLGVG